MTLLVSLIWENTITSHHSFVMNFTGCQFLQRVKFKIAVLAFNCIRGTGAAYFSKVCTTLSSIPGYASTRAAEHGDLFVCACKTKIGGWSFHFASPTVWNSLLQQLHLPTISRNQFKSVLKTHLSKEAYYWHITLKTVLRGHLLTYLLTYLSTWK